MFIPFHVITLDFIVTLLVSNKGFDYAILVIYKFSKRVTIIPGIAKYTAKDWAKALLERFEIVN